MRGVARFTLFGFLTFTIIFDLLILGAILHGNSTPSFVSPAPIQSQPEPQTTEYEYTDFVVPTNLVELPLINAN